MCSIAGIVSFNNIPLHSEKIIRMCDAVAHRGPDGEGYLFGGNNLPPTNLLEGRLRVTKHIEEASSPLLLGHRRLSIIDLSTTAAQPMNDVTGRYWIVFNGEIYNHSELRKELISKGLKFKTDHSDTEVLLNAYAAWGEACLERLRGMFAFAIWDKLDNSFFIARDRIGIKPLYYTIKNSVFYFASEIKQLLVNKEISRDLDPASVSDYLTFLAVPAPYTIFKSIQKLPAAHYITIKGGVVSEPTQYWNVLAFTPSIHEEKQAIEGLLENFEQAVKYRMEADVEYGVLLSGGLDSSANLAMVSKHTSRPVKAFSVGFSNKIKGYKNELPYAEQVAKLFGAQHFVLELTDADFNSFLPEMVYLQDEPIADTANIPIYYLSKLAKANGVTVLLGGEGSDETLIGYRHWALARQFHKLFGGKHSKIAASVAQTLHNLPYLRDKRISYKNWYPKILRNQTTFWSGTELRTDNQKELILSGEFRTRNNGYSSYDRIKPYYEKFLNSGRTDYFDWMSYIDLSFRLPELLLARLDRMTMAASVEGRVPFLDHKFVEFCMSINPSMKVNNTTEKLLLKKAFAQRLPENILYRPKDGFTVPLNNLLYNAEFKELAIHSMQSLNDAQGIFDSKYLTSIINNKEKGKDLWNVLNLSLWYDKIVKV